MYPQSVSYMSLFLGRSHRERRLPAGVMTVLIGQFLRSTAMIMAASNFSHAVALRKRAGHHLVTDGVYASVTFGPIFITSLTEHSDGLDTHPMLVSFIGPWERSSFYRIPYLFLSTWCC